MDIVCLKLYMPLVEFFEVNHLIYNFTGESRFDKKAFVLHTLEYPKHCNQPKMYVLARAVKQIVNYAI